MLLNEIKLMRKNEAQWLKKDKGYNPKFPVLESLLPNILFEHFFHFVCPLTGHRSTRSRKLALVQTKKKYICNAHKIHLHTIDVKLLTH